MSPHPGFPALRVRIDRRLALGGLSATVFPGCLFPGCLFLGCLLLFLSAPALAVEEPEQFLGKLRERGYLDTAGDYLEFLKNSDFVDDEFKKTIPYERAVILSARASTVGDRAQRDLILNKAIAQFKAFAESQPDSPRANDVRFQIANVYVALAKAGMARSQQPGFVRETAEKEAREYYKQALAEVVHAEQLIQASRKKIRSKLVNAGKAAGRKDGSQSGAKRLTRLEKKLIGQRDKLRTDWINSELLQVKILDLHAATYPEGSEQRKSKVGKAAAEYEKMFEKHDGRLIGLFCRLQQGRCLTELGDYERALDCFVELIDLEQSENPLQKNLGLESIRYTIECNIGQKKYKAAIELAQITLRDNVKVTPVTQAIQFLQAKAEVDWASILGPDQKGLQEKLRKQASQIFLKLAKSKSNNEWKDKAIEALVAMGREIEEKPKGEPKNFDEAFSSATAIMQRRRALTETIAKAADEKKEELQKKRSAANEQAFKYYTLAIEMTDNESLPAKVKSVQSALCYLFFERGDNLRAAVLGEYLGRKYPGGKEDKFGTNVALNAWLKEFGEAGENNDFEKQRIERLAKRIIERWADSKEAAGANNYLLTFAIQDGDAEKALEYLEKIPRESSRRGKAQISVGQLLFNRYVTDKKLSDEARPDAESLNAARERAAGFLAQGLRAYEQKSSVDRSALAGAFALAQVNVNQNAPLKAIEFLEHKNYGPLTLVEAGHPLIAEPNYQLKIYRLALRSYIAALPNFQDQPQKRQELVHKAFGIINKMEKAVESDADAEYRLTQIYIDLGKDLEIQIKDLEDQGNDVGKEALSGAFVKFLQQIKNRPQATTYKTMIWIAETYFTLGKSHATEGSSHNKADKYFSEAAQVYQRILKKNLYKNPRQKITIEMRLAACYRGQKKFKESLAQLEGVLRVKPGNVKAQLQAAETLYEAGVDDCDNYVKSFLGAVKDDETDRNRVWGWKKLSQQTEAKESLASYFYTAKLYGVRARRMYAECIRAKDPRKATKLFAAAEGNLLQIFSEHPKLGGPEFMPEFEAEMRQVQQALGKKEVGFPAVAPEAVGPSPVEAAVAK